jgi:hypothetical protein
MGGTAHGLGWGASGQMTASDTSRLSVQQRAISTGRLAMIDTRSRFGRGAGGQKGVEMYGHLSCRASGMQLPFLLRFRVLSGSDLGHKTTILTENFRGC